jgi:hypothetical protein
MPFQHALNVEASTLPLRVNVWGEQKTGKTSFALSFPRPTYYFNFDLGLMELLALKPELRDGLYFENYALPPNPTLEEGEALLQKFVDEWREATIAAEAQGGTVVLDTATHLKDLVSYVKMTQKLEEKIKKAQAMALKANKPFDPDMVQLMRPDYSVRNQLMNAILAIPALANVNAVYIWKAREKYSGNGQATGQYEGDLFKDAPYIAQGTLARRRGGIGKNVFFTTTVEDWRDDPTLNGETFPEDVVANYEDLKGILR